jgi:methylase of polypeptide subunit release factors
MSDRTDLPAILTRTLLAAASARASSVRKGSPGIRDESGDLFEKTTSAHHPEAVGPTEFTGISEQSHRFLADLITLLLLEMEGLVESPLNRRSRARVRLGAPTRCRLLSEWEAPAEESEASVSLFASTEGTPTLPSAPGPEAFYQEVLKVARSTAVWLSLDANLVEELVRWLMPVIVRCDPEDDPVGWIHAHAQRHRLVRGPGTRLRFQVDRARGRSQGVLYTPPPLTEALVEAVLSCRARSGAPAQALLFGDPARDAGRPSETARPHEGAARPRQSSSMPTPRILDPACGSGQFLLSIARRLLNGSESGGLERKPEDVLEIFRSMYGVDIDPGAARLAAFNLSIQAVRALCRSQGADPPVVVQWLHERLGPGFPWFLGTQIHHGNALLLAPHPEGTTFRWTDRFAEVFEGDRSGFDIVIGNPPWVSYGLRDRAGAEEEEAAYLRRIYTFGAQYKLSLYPLFIELALRLTRPGGLHGFLVPDSFFTGRHFSRIRKHLLETCQPILFCLVESGPWPGVHVGHTAFYCVRRLPAPDAAGPVTTSVLRLVPAGRRRKQSATSAASAALLPLFSGSGDGEGPVLVDPSVFHKTPHHAFRIYRDRSERDFVDSMERSPLRFEDVVETYSGLIARHGQESVTGPGEGEFVLKDRGGKVVLRDPDPRLRWRPALHSGSEVEPFRIRWRGGCVYIPEDYEILRRVYKSGFDIERYAAPKVFLRQTGDRLIAARDESGLFCLNNVHVLTARTAPRIDIRFLCGLLMSEPIHRYYQSIALEAGRPLAQVDLVTVRALPFPCDANGIPFGEAPTTRRAPRSALTMVLQRCDEAVFRGRSDAAVELVLEAAQSASDRDCVSAIVCRLVEIIEGDEKASQTKAQVTAREVLDGAVAVLFSVSSASKER